MEESLIELLTANLAKEKGFDKESLYFYKNDLEESDYLYNELIKNKSEAVSNFNPKYEYDKNIAISVAQAVLQKWLREVHNIHVEPTYDELKDRYNCHFIVNRRNNFSSYYDVKTYEESLELGLQEGLKLIKI